MQGCIAIFQTRKCLKNGARRGYAPRRSEVKKSRKDFFSNLLSIAVSVATRFPSRCDVGAMCIDTHREVYSSQR
jgi:hypothetical protein